MTIFLVLSLVLVLSTESMAAPTVSYDELLLVLQWPTSYCNTGKNCILPIPREFTVHGLWPNENSKKVICPTPDPKIKKLYRQISSDLRKDLEIYWPNLNSQTRPAYLWEHEYENHGYCFIGFHNPVDYFQTALTLATDIGDVLITMRLSSGQKIKRGQFYQVEDFKHVTIAGTKLIPGLRCNKARNSAIPQLHEIVFCTDRDKILKNCASNYVIGCGRPWMNREGKVRSARFKFP